MAVPSRPSGMSKEIYDFNVAILSIGALFALGIMVVAAGIQGGLLWVLYIVLGAPMMRFGMWLIDVIVAKEKTEIGVGRAFVYLCWPIVIPLLALSAFVVTMFRLALDHMG